MTDSFNPEEFLGASFTEPTDTRKTPCPAGEWPAVVDSIKPRVWESDKGGVHKAGVAYDVFWSITDPSVLAELGKEKVLVKQSFMFNFIEGTQVIDQEKAKTDVRFGRFREAIELNDTEFTWLMAIGRMARVKVEHEMYEGNPQDKVTGCLSL